MRCHGCSYQTELAHETIDPAAGNVYAFTVHLFPDLAAHLDLPVGQPDPLDLGGQTVELLAVHGSIFLDSGASSIPGAIQPESFCLE